MTPQQHADQLLSEHQANRGRNMTLEHWRANVSTHLQFIEAGAEMAARHARMLPIKPAFTTHAQDELAEVRRVLSNALATLDAAKAAYDAKPLESDRAA